MDNLIKAESITMNMDGTVEPSKPIQDCGNTNHEFGYSPEIIDDVMEVNLSEGLPDSATCRSCGLVLGDFKKANPDAFDRRWKLLEDWQDDRDGLIGWSEFVAKVVELEGLTETNETTK